MARRADPSAVPSDPRAVLEQWTDAPAPSARWRKATADLLAADLDVLDAAGLDTAEVRDALEDFRAIERTDYDRDDSEGFQADIEDSWEMVLEALRETQGEKVSVSPANPFAVIPEGMAGQALKNWRRMQKTWQQAQATQPAAGPVR